MKINQIPFKKAIQQKKGDISLQDTNLQAHGKICVRAWERDNVLLSATKQGFLDKEGITNQHDSIVFPILYIFGYSLIGEGRK